MHDRSSAGAGSRGAAHDRRWFATRAAATAVVLVASLGHASAETTVAPSQPVPTAPAITIPPAPAEAPTAPRATISFIAGMSIPITGLNYNAGIGVRGGANLGKFYLGGLLALHQGDAKTITYGPVSSLGIPGGAQHYSSLPIFLVADGGYNIGIPLGRLSTVLTPYLCVGAVVMNMQSSGVYGDSTITPIYAVVGGGFSYDIAVGARYSIGIHTRVFNTGDTDFKFGDLSKHQYEHGFSTSIFYAAVYTELSYRL
jgi:hypothetical protein